MNEEASLGFNPRKWQKVVLREKYGYKGVTKDGKKVEIPPKRFIVVAVHRRGGKTVLACNMLAKAVFESQNALFAYIAPERTQAKIIAWDCLKSIFEPIIKKQNEIKKFDKNFEDVVTIMESELKITVNKTHSSIQLFGADKPDRARGVKLAGVVMDEVAQMPAEMWSEIIRPALMDSHGWALFIGTPKGINLFSELYNQEQRNPTEWKSLKFDCYQTQALPLSEIEEYKATTTDEVFRREMMCDFTASGDDQVISLQQAKDAVNREVNEQWQKYTNLVLGIDVARYGKDKTVLFFRKGMQAYQPIFFKNMDFYQQAIRIKEICDERQPRAIFVDGTGMGCGLPDFLKAFGMCNIFDVNFSGVSSDPLYFNTRAQLWFKLQEWLKQGGSIPKDENLVQELAMPLYEVTADSKYKLESKDKIKKRLHGKSPDYADALALTFFVNFDKNLLQQNNPFKQFKKPTVIDDVNPFTVFEKERKNDFSSVFTALDQADRFV